MLARKLRLGRRMYLIKQTQFWPIDWPGRGLWIGFGPKPTWAVEGEPIYLTLDALT